MIPRTVFFIVIAAFLVRILFAGFLLYSQGETALFTSDSYGFLITANNILAGNGFSLHTQPPFIPEAHFTPLYPLLIAGSITLGGSVLILVIIQITLSSFLPLLVWKIAGFLTEKGWPRVLASALAAFELTGIFWSVLVLTEVVAIFFLLCALLFFLKMLEDFRLKNAFLAGLFLSISTLTRPHAQFIFLLATAFLSILIISNRYYSGVFSKKRIAGAAIFVMVFVAVLSPWIVRNYIQFGTLDIATTGLRNLYSSFGASVLTLHSGKHFGEIRDGLNDEFARKYGITVRELKDDPSYGSALSKEGFEIIKARPKEAVEVAGIALVAFLTQDLYIDYLQRFKVIPGFQIDFSPSLILLKEGPAKLASLIWERLGWYSLIPTIGRMFWIAINLGWIAALVSAFLKKDGSFRPAAIMAVIIMSYALTSTVGGFGDQGRFRYPSSYGMFLLASLSIFTSWNYLKTLLSRKKLPAQ